MLALVLAYIAASALDIWVTKRILTNSPTSELNPLAKWASKYFDDPLAGSIVGVAIPRLAVLIAAANFPLALAFLTGVSVSHGVAQIWALKKGII